MVLFVDLDDEVEPPELKGFEERRFSVRSWEDRDIGGLRIASVEERENPNRNGMTEALGCYP
jgi:hypothetical protein